MADDIADRDMFRRGKPCWYRRPEVGPAAVNDVLLLDNCIYQLLKRHFRNSPYYTSIIDLVMDVSTSF